MPFQHGLANIASAIADPAREAILTALADGRALPAGALADIAGISPQSASRHLQRLVAEGLLRVWPQGRHRYYRLADEETAALLETMSALAARAPCSANTSRRISPARRRFRFARRCYNHLAGHLGVALAEALAERGYVCGGESERDARFTATGRAWLNRTGVQASDPPEIRLCLDGTERRPHFAGPAATAILDRLLAARHLAPVASEPRALRLTASGRGWFAELGIRIDFPGAP